MKNNKGITLISLIGYIIISLMVIAILMVVTGNFKRNFGELNVQTVHDVEFDKINLQISKEIREGKGVNREQTTENKLVFKDNNSYTYSLEDKAIYQNDKVKVAEYIESCKFEIIGDETLRLTAKIEGKERTIEYAINLYVDRSYLKIGDYVSYTSDTANTYNALGISTDENANPSGSANNGTTGIPQDTTLKWRIINIKDDGSVSLISENPIASAVDFKGALGFNNGVLLLNDLCKKHYSNINLGAVGRSINLIDIESGMNNTGIEARNLYTTEENIKYGADAKYSPDIKIPDIYKHSSKTLAGESLDYYHTPTTLITVTESTLEAKNTYYYLPCQESYFKEREFYNIIFNSNNTYWIASRYTYCQPNDVSFGLRQVSNNIIGGSNLYNSASEAESDSSFIRPVVQLSPEVKISQTGGTATTPRTLSK